MSPRQDFGKDSRLLDAHDFRRVFDKASFRISSAGFVILARGQDRQGPRLGLVIAKKNSRRAVDRNRIKRLARETFRLRRDSLGPCDFVVLTRTGVDRMPNQALHSQLADLWSDAARRVALLRGPAQDPAHEKAPTPS